MKLPALKEIVEERKAQAIENLSARFSENRLPLEEYERLVEYINKIESERELFVVEKIVAEYGGAVGGAVGGAEDVRDFYGDDERADYGIQSSMRGFTILSARTMTGPVPHGSQFINILGSGNIKIRREDLRRRRTGLQVFCILGESVIQVERGIQVTNTAIPVLGAVWTDRGVGKTARNSGPELFIGGAALLGNISVRLLKDEA
ncbi:MAG: hypothetical protein LBG76_02670 [Treponema sp.]|jgi:hypothetical protein|nr:hypothetical protein [Treponema sp.]